MAKQKPGGGDGKKKNTDKQISTSTGRIPALPHTDLSLLFSTPVIETAHLEPLAGGTFKIDEPII
jgi:hypothetical protein